MTIDWQATDPVPSSGRPTDPPNTLASTEGTGVAYTSAASCDPAGNCATGSLPLSIDKTAPAVICPSPTPTVLLGETGAAVSATVSDLLSGAVAATVSAPADSASVGAKTVSLLGQDRAGNTRTASCPYQVVYVFNGFLAPVDEGGILNVVKAGRAIPLKWKLTDASGAPVTDYQPNWKTPSSYAGSCKMMRLDIGEGLVHAALFQFSNNPPAEPGAFDCWPLKGA